MSQPSDIVPELAFLARHGFGCAVLHEASRLARLWKIGGDEALLASGLGRPEALYRALAAELRLPYRAETDVDARTPFPSAILKGVAPLGPDPSDGFLCAPRGAAFGAFVRRGAAWTVPLAITTPETLRRAVFAARGPYIALQAAEALARERPQDSFHAGLTWRQLVVTLGLATGVGGLAVWNAGALLGIVLLALSMPFFGLAAIKIAAAQEPFPIRMPRAIRRDPVGELPVYTVLVPLHREGRVLGQLLAAIRALDYPAARLDVKLLVEEGDAETASELARHELPGFVEVLTVPPGHPRTKPRALNVGLALARGRYLVVYDAEDVPEPGQLRHAVAIFERSDPDIACLQARLVIDNTDDGVLTRFFTLEYGALFDVINPALTRFDLPMPLGGTSNHLKTDMMKAVGGWDPWNVTEDADLAIRLATSGFRIGDLPSTTLEEAPSTLRGWLAQRSRWMKGFLQVTITHSRHPVRNVERLGLDRAIGATVLIFGAVASALAYPVFALALLAQIAWGWLPSGAGWSDAILSSAALTLALAGLLAMIVPPVVAMRRRGWRRLWPYALAMPLYYLLVSAAAWRGLFELLVDPDRWNKTEHGLARTSRAEAAERDGAVTDAAASPGRPRPAVVAG